MKRQELLRFAVMWTLVFAFGGNIPVAAQEMQVSTESAAVWLSNNFEGTPYGTRANEGRQAITQVITGSISGELKHEKFETLTRVSLLTDVRSRSVSGFQTTKMFKDEAFRGGHLSEIEVLEYWSARRHVSVGGGYTNFSVQDNTLRPVYYGIGVVGGFMETTSSVRYQGLAIAGKSDWTFQRVDLMGDVGIMPWLTRTDSYNQSVTIANWGIEKFKGNSSTPAKGWQIRLRTNVRLNHSGSLAVTGGIGFREATTPFGNHLMVVVPTEIQETAKWKSVSGGISFKF
jgi:hypothetical protein